MRYFQSPANGVFGYDDTQQELIDQAIANEWQEVTDSWPPPPAPPTALQNREIAERLLMESDYSQLPDVNLKNRDEFVVYRSQLREIATNPISGNIDWPKKPKNEWGQHDAGII